MKGMRNSQRLKSLTGGKKTRRDREMAFAYLARCRQLDAKPGQWCRKAVAQCAILYNRKRRQVRLCIRQVVETTKNQKFAEAAAPYVPSATVRFATPTDRLFTKMDQAEVVKALAAYLGEGNDDEKNSD